MLDQFLYNNELIQSPFNNYLPSYSNICRTTSGLFFYFFKFKVSLEGLKKKNNGGDEVWGMCDPHGQRFLGRISYSVNVLWLN